MTLASFIPADRGTALAAGRNLPEVQQGAALFADIGGFTPLAEGLERALRIQRGAEQLAIIVKQIFDPLVCAVHDYHGSIIAFSGDSMTCWFDGDDGRSAAASALEMQAKMQSAGRIEVPGLAVGSAGLKVTVAAGRVRRFQVGDPAIRVLDCIVGGVVDRLADGDHLCRPGDVLVDEGIAARLGTLLRVDEWRQEPDGGARFARVTGLTAEIPKQPWAAVPDERIAAEHLRPWVLPPLYDRLQSGQTRFLAEFRPIAALFAKFGGIDYDTDPEAGEHLNAFVSWATQVIAQHGGFLFGVSTVDKGSYLVSVFGAPVAHGDDIRRAVAAAQELRHPPEALRGIRDVRIGVNAGRVFAGLYSGLRSAYGVSGDSVNLAARLMQAAAPGQALISAQVGAALDRHFVIRALDPILVKGRRAPIAICDLVGPAGASVRVSEPRYPLPLVGRNDEIRAIDEAIAAVRRGRGQVLAFSGDAGMGKSRLVNETIQRATAASFACFADECHSYGTATAYLPWQLLWNGIFGLSGEDPPEQRQQQLAAALGEAAIMAPLLDRVLDLPMADNDATRPMPAPVRKQTLELILVGCLRARASQGPIAVVLEDCHWIDSLSHDLLSAIAAAITDVPVLIVLAYRPAELEDSVHFRAARIANLKELRLVELAPAESQRLVTLLMAHLAERSGVPAKALVAQLTERAQGNPFYIEELVRFVHESRLDLADEAELERLELPESLGSVILQRIDRLGEREQLTVKVSSVIGRRFLVEWLLGAYEAAIDSRYATHDLEHIREAGLIVIDTPPPELAYLFRHALVREVAYETLSYQLRQELHERLARYLEATSDDRRPVDLLAYHYARSANRAKEAEFRQLSAELAIRNGAYGDALEHVRRASEIMAAEPDPTVRLAGELELQLLLGTILLVVKGQGSAEAKTAYDRARELARSVPPGPALGRAVFGLWTYYLFQGLMRPAGELAEEAVALTSRSPDPGVRIMAQLAVCQTHLWTGQWQKCAEHFNEVLALYDPAHHEAYITQYAQNPRFTATGSGFWALWALGRRDQAAAAVDRAIRDASAVNHEFTYVIAYLNRPLLAYLDRREDLLGASIGELIERTRRARNPFYIALALSLEGWFKVVSGQYEEGLAQLAEHEATMRALGSKLVEPLVTALRAEGCLRANRIDEGLAILGERFDLYSDQGRLSFIPEHLRIRAELLLALSDAHHEAALADLRHAIEVARAQGALAFELRAALSLANALRRRGHHANAAACVESVYRRFGEGFETPDLCAAAALVNAI
jgi:adenylate cyclase